MDKCAWIVEFVHINFNNADEFVRMMETVVQFKDPLHVLALVCTWKIGGNILFQRGQVRLADEIYATALKLRSYLRAMELCSLAISILPGCTKEWFRRGKVATTLGLFSLDKEIKSELGKVTKMMTENVSFVCPEGSSSGFRSSDIDQIGCLNPSLNQQLHLGEMHDVIPAINEKTGLLKLLALCKEKGSLIWEHILTLVLLLLRIQKICLLMLSSIVLLGLAWKVSIP